jgi:hypothetical protein
MSVKKHFKKKSFWIVALVFVLLLMVKFLSDEALELPEELYGEWVTTNPKYADRFFELNRTLITIGIGENDFDSYSISKIEKTDLKKGALYTVIYHESPNSESKFSFYYDPSNEGVIRLKNPQKIEWKKRRI